jgi:hypothetical protein
MGTLLVKETNEALRASKYPETSENPEDWFKAVVAAPSIAQALEVENWKAAVMLSRAFLDASRLSGVHTYEVVGLAQSGRLIVTVPLSEVSPMTIDTSTQTVVNPPRLWNVTPALAHSSLAAKKAVGTPPDGADDPTPEFLPAGSSLHTLAEKAHGQVYLKIAPPKPQDHPARSVSGCGLRSLWIRGRAGSGFRRVCRYATAGGQQTVAEDKRDAGT